MWRLVFLDLPVHIMKSVLIKLCFIHCCCCFFQTTSGISGSTESIDLSCIHVSYVRLYINLAISELEEWLLSTQERATCKWVDEIKHAWEIYSMYVKANILRHLHLGIGILSLLKDVTLWRAWVQGVYSLQSLEHFKHIDMVIRMTQCNRAWLQLFKYCLKFAYFWPHHQGLHPNTLLSWERMKDARSIWLNITAEWPNHLNWYKVLNHGQHNLTRF